MSNQQNDELLENLFEEELTDIYFYILERSEGNWKPSKEDREEMKKLASKRAIQKFEDLCQ